MTAAQRLTDALRYIESVDVRFNIGATSLILGGLVMNSYTPLIDMCEPMAAPTFMVMSWVAAGFSALLSNSLLLSYYRQRNSLARHMEQILLRDGMFVQTFDQLFADEAPRTLWGKALRSQRSLALSSDSLVTRIVGMVRHYHFLCRRLKLPPRPPELQARWNSTRLWLSLTLLSGPLLLLLGLASGTMRDTAIMNANGDVFAALYMAMDELGYQLDFLPAWLAGLPKLGVIAALAYFVLLWPALRLLPVMERAILRRVLHDIVAGESHTGADLLSLRQAEEELTALRERVEESHQDLARRGIRQR